MRVNKASLAESMTSNTVRHGLFMWPMSNYHDTICGLYDGVAHLINKKYRKAIVYCWGLSLWKCWILHPYWATSSCPLSFGGFGTSVLPISSLACHCFQWLSIVLVHRLVQHPVYYFVSWSSCRLLALHSTFYHSLHSPWATKTN